MADVPQTPTAGAPARTDLMPFFPPAGTGDPVTRTVDDALRASTGRRTTNADGNITAADLDKTVVVTGSTARTQTLPDITGAVDDRYLVRIVNGSTADQTISGNGSDTINGSASIVLEPTEAILLQPAASGTAWMILSREKTGRALVATYTSLPDESQTWQDIPGTWADTDRLQVIGVAQAAAGTQPLRAINIEVKVGNIRANNNDATTSNRLWLVWADQQGARFQLRRKRNAATTLQICEAGAVQSTDLDIEVWRL